MLSQSIPWGTQQASQCGGPAETYWQPRRHRGRPCRGRWRASGPQQPRCMHRARPCTCPHNPARRALGQAQGCDAGNAGDADDAGTRAKVTPCPAHNGNAPAAPCTRRHRGDHGKRRTRPRGTSTPPAASPQALAAANMLAACGPAGPCPTNWGAILSGTQRERAPARGALHHAGARWHSPTLAAAARSQVACCPRDSACRTGKPVRGALAAIS